MELIASNDRMPRRPTLQRAAALARLAVALLSIGSLFSSFAAIAAAKRPAGSAAAIPLPDGLKIPIYTPGPIPFHRSEQLVFQASWIGIPAAEAKIVLLGEGKDPALFSGEAWIRTNRLVDVLFKMRDYMRENFSRSSLAPRDIYIAQRENKRRDEYLVNFNRGAGVVTMVKRNRRGIDTRRFEADNPWGPISGAVMALSQPLTVGQKFTFDVFAGRNRYVISFEVARRERIKTPLGQFDALRVVPSFVYLSDNDARKKARETTVWISADGRHLPLRLEASAFIGTVRIDLVRVGDAASPAASGPTPARSPRASESPSPRPPQTDRAARLRTRLDSRRCRRRARNQSRWRRAGRRCYWLLDASRDEGVIDGQEA